jgi:hypothetical protein
MWKPATSLVVLLLVASSRSANAQTQCPELARLRAEAVAAAKPTQGAHAPALGRCETHIRISIAWNDVAKYASDHREACDVSSPMLDAIEKAHREAVKARDNACTGRPVLSYPAEIILR